VFNGIEHPLATLAFTERGLIATPRNAMMTVATTPWIVLILATDTIRPYIRAERAAEIPDSRATATAPTMTDRDRFLIFGFPVLASNFFRVWLRRVVTTAMPTDGTDDSSLLVKLV
jgi:hypothetical protein